jgi:hypothetical protein
MNAITPPVRTVLDLFTTHLSDVRFGDVDAQALARLADETQSAAEVVAYANAALESARVVLHERQEALLLAAHRALAYARVYAEADEALSAHLEAVTLPRAARRSSKAESNASTGARAEANDEALVLTSDPQPGRRPRGRPRKVPLTTTTTFAIEAPMLDGLEPIEGSMRREEMAQVGE